MSITTLSVRKASWPDQSQLSDMIWTGYVEQDIFKPSKSKIQEMMRRAFDNDGAILGAVGSVGNVEGIIYLSIGQFCYTDDWCLEEVFNYVRPEYRRSTNAKDMIAFGKRCSDEIGIPLVIGVVSNERTKAKMELYRRQLGDPVGGYFCHRPASAGLQKAEHAAL